MKRVILSVVVAGVGAIILVNMADRRSLEEIVGRAAIAEQADAPGAKCPLSRDHIDKANIDLLSICLKYGLGAYDAAQRYPTTASELFALYGDNEVFRRILDQFGHEVIPVVAYFVENGSRELQVRQALGEAWEQLWAGKRPTWDLDKITHEQIGLIAIYQIAARGHELLAEFEIVGGAARQKPVTHLVFEAKDLLYGGIGDVERVLVRGERLPTWQEVGFSVLDVGMAISGVGAITRVARGGSRAAVGKTASSLMTEGAVAANKGVAKTAARIAPFAVAYIAITRPELFAAIGGSIAEYIGIDRLFGVFAFYFIAILLVLQLFRPLTRCVYLAGRLYRRPRQIHVDRFASLGHV